MRVQIVYEELVGSSNDKNGSIGDEHQDPIIAPSQLVALIFWTQNNNYNSNLLVLFHRFAIAAVCVQVSDVYMFDEPSR